MKKKTTPQKQEKGPALERVYETEIEYMCPVRGLVKQKVTVKKYQGNESVRLIDSVRQSNNLADQLDQKHSGILLDEDDDDEDDKLHEI